MFDISVIVPVYNVEKYIKRCIKSVLTQSFVDFELIIVIDGSSDNCAKICEEYALMDQRIQIIHQKNLGVSFARNNGVRLSNGEYVSFIDSDDYIDIDYLFKLYDVCVHKGAEMVCCDYVVASNNKFEEIRCCDDEIKVFSNRDAISFYSEINLKEGNSLFRSSCARIVQRDIVLKNLFPIDRTYAEDAACVYLWMMDSNMIVHLNYCGYYYCQNDESICHRAIGNFFVGNFLTEREWIRFYKRNNFQDLYKLTVERYFFDAASAYRNSQCNPIFLKFLRSGIIRYSRKAGITIKGNEYYYELAFPVEMRFYWYYQAVKKRLKRK